MSEQKKKRVNRYSIDAVDRALVLLGALAAKQGVSAAYLASSLGANRSLVFRLLSTFADRGFVSKDVNNRYWLGPQLLYLGLEAQGDNALINASNDVMDALVKDTQESVGLIIRDELETVRVAYRESSQLIRLHSSYSSRRALYGGGDSKLLLAYAPEEVI